jgi:hypothetical protein
MKTMSYAIAQTVSRRFATAATRVGSLVRSCGISGGQSGTGVDYLRVPRFPLPILIPTVLYSLIIRIISTLHNLDTDSVVK